VRTGRISMKTAEKYLEKNRQLPGDDRPATPYRSGREYIKGVLGGEGVTFNDEVVAGAVKTRTAQALEEFDVWMQAHPNATLDEVREFYRKLGERAQALSLGDAELNLVAPRYLGGLLRDEITVDALKQAEARALDDFEAGRLSKAEFAIEHRRIEDWRRVRAKQSQAKTTPTP
jgi:hypothetical protein